MSLLFFIRIYSIEILRRKEIYFYLPNLCLKVPLWGIRGPLLQRIKPFAVNTHYIGLCNKCILIDAFNKTENGCGFGFTGKHHYDFLRFL